MNVDIDWGQDLRWDTVQVELDTAPSSLVATAGVDYDMYRRGANNLFTREKVNSFKAANMRICGHIEKLCTVPRTAELYSKVL